MNSVNTATQLLDLNDDCLLEILQYLSIHQTLGLLGNLSRRIDDIIYKSLSLVKCLSFNLRNPPEFSTQQLLIIGRGLRKLYITAGYSLPGALTLNYLQPICSHKRLQYLSLHYVDFNEHFQDCVMHVAEQLKSLDLSFCQLTDELLGPILEKAINLQTLTLFGNYSLKFASLNCIRSQHLRDLKVEQNYVCKDEIKKFSAKNKQIKVVIFTLGYLGHARDM